MELIVEPSGDARYVYDELVDFGPLGLLAIERASQVEPDGDGRWVADMSPVGGPALGPFSRRSEALAAEAAWLAEHWLMRPA